MGEAVAYLFALDEAWSHSWESLASVLGGVEEDEAAWQPPAYANEPREAGWPPAGSLSWHVAHLARCKHYYAEVIAARERLVAEPAARVPLPSFAAERSALEAAHAAERLAFLGIGDEELDLRCGGKMALRSFLAMAVRHDVWHGGSMATVRRLWRTSRVEGTLS